MNKYNIIIIRAFESDDQARAAVFELRRTLGEEKVFWEVCE